jgi:hypothetical protein
MSQVLDLFEFFCYLNEGYTGFASKGIPDKQNKPFQQCWNGSPIIIE